MVIKRIVVKLIQSFYVEREKKACQDTDHLVQ